MTLREDLADGFAAFAEFLDALLELLAALARLGWTLITVVDDDALVPDDTCVRLFCPLGRDGAPERE